MFMSGLLVWNFFNLSTLSATGVVVGSANLVRKVRFPRVVLPLASVGFAAVHFVLQMLVFFAFLLVFYRAFIGPQLVLLEQLVPKHLFALFMANPMTAVVTSIQRAIYRYPVVVENGAPVKVLATGGYSFYLKWLGVAGIISVALLAIGLVVFRRMQADFAEEL